MRARVLIWAGSPAVQWKKLVATHEDWDCLVDCSQWGLLTYWRYRKYYRAVRHDLLALLRGDLAGIEIAEVCVASDDEYLSLTFIEVLRESQGTTTRAKISLLEDGLALYLRTRHLSELRQAARMAIGLVFGKQPFLTGFGYMLSNPLFKKVYATFPGLVPGHLGREIIDIGSGFRDTIRQCAMRMGQHTALPPGSGLILSQNLAPRVTSRAAEERLMVRMIRYLVDRCGSDKVYVKYHHFDSSGKRALFEAHGVRDIGALDVPYELLEQHLRPRYVVASLSSALLYSSLLGGGATPVAFCGSIRSLGGARELFTRLGIEVV